MESKLADDFKKGFTCSGSLSWSSPILVARNKDIFMDVRRLSKSSSNHDERENFQCYIASTSCVINSKLFGAVLRLILAEMITTKSSMIL